MLTKGEILGFIKPKAILSRPFKTFTSSQISIRGPQVLRKTGRGGGGVWKILHKYFYCNNAVYCSGNFLYSIE